MLNIIYIYIICLCFASDLQLERWQIPTHGHGNCWLAPSPYFSREASGAGMYINYLLRSCSARLYPVSFPPFVCAWANVVVIYQVRHTQILQYAGRLASVSNSSRSRDGLRRRGYSPLARLHSSVIDVRSFSIGVRSDSSTPLLFHPLPMAPRQIKMKTTRTTSEKQRELHLYYREYIYIIYIYIYI